ncbi:MAG: nucleoside diphosphate kinase regulator [Gemmobacter sp.]
MTRKSGPPRVTIDQTQLEPLERLAQGALGRNPDLADRLLDELSRARILPPGKMPADVICLGNRATFRDETTGKEQSVVLVLPEQADIDTGKVSVLTPIGVALIGLQAGARFSWETRGGETRELTVVRVEAVEPD